VRYFAALYMKELRAQRMVAAVLLLGTLGIAVYALTGVGENPSARAALIVLPYASALGLPFLLVHTISGEWTAQTHYQILALPVPRWMVLLAKVAVVLSLGLVIYVCSTVFLQLISERMTTAFVTNKEGGFLSLMEPHASASSVWGFAGIVYGVLLLPLIGIACAAAGVRVMAQRFKGLATVGVFVVGGYLYAKLQAPVVGALVRIFGEWRLDLAIHRGMEPTSDAHLLLMYSALFAALGIGVGALLFERYVEA
jgi:hypothetical protein